MEREDNLKIIENNSDDDYICDCLDCVKVEDNNFLSKEKETDFLYKKITNLEELIRKILHSIDSLDDRIITLERS